MSKQTELSFISPKRRPLDTILLQRTILARTKSTNFQGASLMNSK